MTFLVIIRDIINFNTNYFLFLNKRYINNDITIIQIIFLGILRNLKKCIEQIIYKYYSKILNTKRKTIYFYFIIIIIMMMMKINYQHFHIDTS